MFYKKSLMLRIPLNRAVESIFVPMKSKDGYYVLDYRGFVLKTKMSDTVDKKLFLETFYNYYAKTLNYSKYEIALEGRDEAEFRRHVAVQAQIEIGMEKFLEEGNYHAFVTHFGMLGGLKQLPGLAVQRLMEKGYGFGGEGDWKTAAMDRLIKIMTAGIPNAKGSSFMEDYTYNFVPGKEGIIQAHMLEVCPLIAEGSMTIKCQPLSMGNREDPARLVFQAKEGSGIATSLIDLGTRFRLLINAVDCKKVEKPLPKLPVGINYWTPQPNLEVGAAAWILAGGAHHTAFSYDLTSEQMGDWAQAMGIEAVFIDKNTNVKDFKKDLMLGSVYYGRR